MKLVIAVLLGVLALASVFVGRGWIDIFQTSERSGPPKKILVRAGEDLQKIIQRATSGDVIELEAGAIFEGPIVLPPKRGNEYITIQSSRLAELPGPQSRVKPSDASLMPKILAVGREAAIKTDLNSHHYRFIGIEFAPANKTEAFSDLIKLGDGSTAQNDLKQVAHHLILDRCYIHGHPTQEVKRGVALNSGEAWITNSYISDIHGIGYDTQAICGWNGPGPYHIINNYLEGAGENLMFGGADPSIPNLVPSDIEIRRNTFYKPLSWKVGDPSYAGKHWTIKNLLELKNARRVVIDGNTFENSWVDAQVGFAILIKSQNQDGRCPWCVSEDVTFSNNHVRNVEHGINILAYDPYHPPPATLPAGTGQVKRVKVINNLWTGIRGMWFQGTDGADSITFEHNSHFQQSGNIMTLYGRPTTNFSYTNNLTVYSGYGVKGDGTADGTVALQKYCPSFVFQRNVIAFTPANRNKTSEYPPENFYPTSVSEVGFSNQESSDYRLSSSSRYRNAASDGSAIGVDFKRLNLAQQVSQ
jgi:hypothetical protein